MLITSIHARPHGSKAGWSGFGLSAVIVVLRRRYPAPTLEPSSPPIAQPHLSASLFGGLRLDFVWSDSLSLQSIKKDFGAEKIFLEKKA